MSSEKSQATGPRIIFLKEARVEQGVHAVEEYAPAKWAIAKGYVTMTEGRFGGRTHKITTEGEAFLLRTGNA
jgi:hypothetical protein